MQADEMNIRWKHKAYQVREKNRRLKDHVERLETENKRLRVLVESVKYFISNHPESIHETCKKCASLEMTCGELLEVFQQLEI